MYQEIRIGDKDVQMVANAATAYRYNQVFHEDLLSFFTSSGKVKKTDSDYITVSQKLAFVMSKQAEKVDFSKLNEDAYVEWLEDNDQFELIQVASDIIDIYQKNQRGSVEAKKKDEAPSGD